VERLRTHFLPDEKNSPWTIQRLIKIGGGNPEHGPVGGTGQMRVDCFAAMYHG